MNKLLIALIGLSLPYAATAEEIDRTLDADSDGDVSISNLAGSVDVVGWNRSQVQVSGTLGKDVEDFIFNRSGRHTTIKVKAPERSWGQKDVASELIIHVPAASSLDIATVSADIDVDDVTGEQDLQSVSGDITTEAFASDIEAGTVSGDVDVAGSGKDADLDLSSVSGDVTGKALSGEVDAEVVSGDVEIDGGSFDRVSLDTVNGDVVFVGGLRKSGKADFESVNGSIDVEFVGPLSARFDIETFNGRIRNCFGPKAERADRHAPGWELSFREGDGDGRVSLGTLNGNLTLCKK